MSRHYGPNSTEVEQFLECLRKLSLHQWSRVGVYILGGFSPAVTLAWESARDAAVESLNDAVTLTRRNSEAKRAIRDAFYVAWNAAPEDEKQNAVWKAVREATGHAAAGIVVCDCLTPQQLNALVAPFAEELASLER